MMDSSRFEDAYPLSPVQEGMLFHALATPDGGEYVTHFRCTFHDLDARAFDFAWNRVVARHPILRSAFVWKNTKKPLQVVVRHLPAPIAFVDCRRLPRATAEELVRRTVEQDRLRGHNPARPPLMRVLLFRLGDGEHRLVWSFHHLLLDGWSTVRVLGELGASYLAARGGEEPDLPPVRPFRDFIAWLQQQDMAVAESFWRRTLEGFDTPIHLPGRGRGPSTGEPEMAAAVRRLDVALGAELQSLTRRLRVTLGTLLQAVWALLLARMTGRRDILFGTVVSGRPPSLEGVDSMVGLFINTLPVRIPIPAGTTVAEWLQTLQGRQVDLLEVGFSPLVQVQRWSPLPPGVALFEVLFTFESYPVDAALSENLSLIGASDLEEADRTHYPLALECVPEAELPLRIDFDRRIYDPALIESLLDQLEALLQRLPALVEGPVAELIALAPSERRHVLDQLNHTDRPFPEELTTGQLFRQRARLFSQRIAVAAPERDLSYAELERLALAVARRLRCHGVGPEVRVGLMTDRIWQMTAGLLGILEAGGVYLPLDPEAPASRLETILAEARPAVVLCQAGLLETLAPALGGAAAMVLDLEAEVALAEADAEAEAALPGPACAANLAYTIYTSGSTGGPKGVQISHRSLVHFTVEASRLFRLTPEDRFLQFSPLGFNVVLEEVFPAWYAGATVVLEPGVDGLSCEDLARLMAARGITAVELPAAYWQQWVREMVETGAAPPASLRLLLLGCEKPQPELLAAWGRWQVPLIFVFGLTETTITSSVYEVPFADPAWDPDAGLPIGKPVANTRLYVLDGELEPMPVGAVGELFIGGVGVGRGYLERPALTASRFVPDPFAGAGGRLYRTGDLARWSPSGDMDFLGRSDHQLKIRGFRVEPAEIETILRRHPEVREAVVTARGEEGAHLRLVAYWVPRRSGLAPEERERLEAELQAAVLEALPAYMVPSLWSVLDELPMTRSGKVDRKALPEVRPTGSSAGTELPRGRVEDVLAAVWAEVLGLDGVGIHDDFFALGGDSIVSLQVVARAQREGVRITPRQVFTHPTVASLAQVAEMAPASVEDQGPVTGSSPLTPIQRWFFARRFADPARWGMPLPLELTRPFEPALLGRALGAVIEHHDALRLAYERREDGWHQTHREPERSLPLAVGDGETTWAEALRTAQDGVDLSGEGSLLSGVFLPAAGEAGSRLLLLAHHLVVDVVSWRILVEDLLAAYEALAVGAEVILPPKTSSFKRWAEALELRGPERVAEERDYWVRQASAATARLPRAEGRANAEGSARTLTVELAEPVSRALVERVPEVYRTEITDVLLAALARALAPWTGGVPFSIELEGHGREPLFDELDLSRTVGCFTSLYPVLLDPAEHDRPGAGLCAVKERLRRLPSNGIGYGILRFLADDEELRAQPSPEILFNFAGALDHVLPAGWPVALAKVDLDDFIDPTAERSHLLEINAALVGAVLRVEWTYGAEIHGEAQVRELADRYVAELEALVEHCLSPEAGGRTPSDFPLAHLDQQTVDALAGKGSEIEDLFPLSPLQQGMLYHSLLAPELQVYTAQSVFEVVAPGGVVAFREAWRRLVARHPALRTELVWEGLDESLQRVRQQVDLPWHQEDLGGLDGAERERRLAEYLARDREQPLDLRRAPLMRFALFDLGEGRHSFVWTYFQGLLDGWSLPVLFQELLDDFRRLVRGAEPVERGAAPRFRDYVAWLASQDPAATQAYWQRRLAGLEGPTLLAEATVGETDVSEGESYVQRQLLLSRELSDELALLGQRHGLTLNTLVQGAWARLLAHYTGAREVVYGVTVAGRPPEVPGIEEMVGVFINTLPMRVGVSLEAPLVEWLRRLQDSESELRQHEHAPLVEVQRWAGLPADAGLFDTLFVFENYPVGRILEEAGSDLEIGDASTFSRSSFPMGWLVVPGRRLEILAKHDRRAVAASTVSRMLRQLEALLEAMVRDPEVSLGELPVATSPERHQLLAEWSGAGVDRLPGSRCLHEGFRAQAAATPEREALRFGDRTLTFRQLDEASDRWAAVLRGLGVGPEERVGLFCRRCPELVVGLLAVLKAGGCYVPLDPVFPPERIALIARDSSFRILLTAGDLPAGDVELPAGATVLELDREPPVPAVPPSAGLAPPAQASHAAYVLYTSGSTGRPKGVVVEHRQVMAYLEAFEERLGGLGGASFAMLQPLAVDSSVSALYPPLLRGGCLHLVSEAAALDPSAVQACLGDHQVGGLKIAPTHLGALQGAAPEAPLMPARWLVVGGEGSSSRWLRGLAQRHPEVAVFNHYGPTETTVGVTMERIRGGGGALPPITPLGRPLGHCRATVLGPGLEPVVAGVVGELFLGGACVARGYLDRPRLTAERFLPDPWGSEPGARRYRSGDRCRWLDDGRLEFLGRADNQVKIRGFRIEPGEVEAVLGQHPRVAACAVVAGGEPGADRALVACLVADGPPVPSSEELAEYLRARLPEHMVPALFVLLDALPRTPHGKLDRPALVAEASRHGRSERPRRPPRTPVEQAMAEIWAQVLRLDQVGVEDDFFQLGGHSLHAIQVLSRIRRTFGVDLPLPRLVAGATVAEAAAAVVQVRAEHAEAEEVERLLAELEELSDEEARDLLGETQETETEVVEKAGP